MRAKGNLLIIGGAEDLGEEDDFPEFKKRGSHLERHEILRELLKSSRNKKIEIITTGSKEQDAVKKRYLKAFRRIGYPNPGFIPIKTRQEARNRHYIQKIKKAGAVFFTGGDQFRLATILGGTKIIDEIKRKYREDKNFLVAGTSAGAMIMSATMIKSGGKCEALIEEDLKISSGLGLLRHCIVDTHFIKRGRFGRLAHAVLLNPGLLGIGLGEDTALIIKNGDQAECRGSGMVVIIDGKNMEQTNITDATANEPIFVENLIVHLLVKGCRFSMRKGTLTRPSIVVQTLQRRKRKK